MRIILSRCRIKQFAAAALLASIGSATAWAAAQVDINLPTPDAPALVVPGYGPGIAGHVIEAPIARHCTPGIPCSRPVANATVLIVDRKTRETVGTAVTNVSGNFLVTVPPNNYLLQVETDGTFPRCPQAEATAGLTDFVPVQITCRSGIR
jgi:hypothetical protein